MANTLWSDFLNWLFPSKFPVDRQIGGSTLTINIPAELYYKELAIYTASSLISNAIGRSEIKTFIGGKPIRGQDYFLLNVSPNRNETSSLFWHRVVNKMIREGEALVVNPSDGMLYCADSFGRREERPILGDIYDSVTVGNFTFNRTFDQSNAYMIRLDDMRVRQLIDGMYADYGKIFAAAAKTMKATGARRYKLHIDGVKAGDTDFNREFEEVIKEQLKAYLEADNAVYPEFDGYKLEADPSSKAGTSADFLALKKELFSTVAAAFHIPDSMMTGNITSMKEIVGSFLTFGVDPYADAITEALNKAAGPINYCSGNFYRVDTSKIQHQSIFDVAVSISNLISSGTLCIDEAREELGMEPLNEEWSRKHFITKNNEEIERYLKDAGEGGENDNAQEISLPAVP